MLLVNSFFFKNRKNVILIFFIFLQVSVFSQKIPFQLMPSGHILVEATVEGKKGNFIFDTAGGINLFFNDFAKDLKEKNTYHFFTAFRATGERIDAPLYKSENLVFANQIFRNVPYSTFDMKLEGIDGLISLQMFQDTDLIIDFDKKEIILKELKPNVTPKSIDIQLANAADNTLDIFTEVWLNGQYPIKVMLDSGAGDNSFWLSDRLLETLQIDKKLLEVIEKKSEFNPTEKTKIYKGSIQSISNQFAVVNTPKVNFVEGLIYEGKTSINWLGKKIGISIKNKKIYILD